MRSKYIGYLILFVIFVFIFVFVWLYETLGAFLFWTLILLIIVGAVYLWINSAKKRHLEFQNLILETIKRRMPVEEARNVYGTLIKSDMRKADLIRKLQIIRDSIEISLSSKKRNVAESRNEKMRELFVEMEQNYKSLMDDDVFKEVSAIIRNANNEFHTALYKNIATGHLEKAEKLKTEKGKKKYWNLAREVLKEGMKNPNSDKRVLEDLINKITNHTRK